MRPTCELPVLPGALMTRRSDDEFFELCRANPSLAFERNAQQEVIALCRAITRS